jgi:hypothetical protein
MLDAAAVLHRGVVEMDLEPVADRQASGRDGASM